MRLNLEARWCSGIALWHARTHQSAIETVAAVRRLPPQGGVITGSSRAVICSITPALLSKVVDRDTNGDLYEYLLSTFASAGVNGQFRTPRHIIKAAWRRASATSSASRSGSSLPFAELCTHLTATNTRYPVTDLTLRYAVKDHP